MPEEASKQFIDFPPFRTVFRDVGDVGDFVTGAVCKGSNRFLVRLRRFKAVLAQNAQRDA